MISKCEHHGHFYTGEEMICCRCGEYRLKHKDPHHDSYVPSDEQLAESIDKLQALARDLERGN